MVVDSDVHDDGGRLLIAAGTALTRAHLETLAARGIASLRIRDPETDVMTPDPLPELTEEDEAHLAHLYRHNDPGHAAVAVLQSVSRERLQLRRAGRRSP